MEIYKKQHMPMLAAGAQAKYRSLLERHILPAFSSLKLCDMDTEAIQAFLNSKQKEGLAWWTRNDLKNIVSGIFSKADDWGYLVWAQPSPKNIDRQAACETSKTDSLR